MVQIKNLTALSDLKVVISKYNKDVSANVKTQAFDAGTLALAYSDNKEEIAKFIVAKMNSYKKGNW